MKKRMKIIAAVVLALAMLGAAFWAGGYIENQKNQATQVQNCLRLISFAKGTVENEDLSYDFSMKDLSSQVYGAWCFCDKENSTASGRLYDLWNSLMRDGVDNKERLISQLDAISDSIRTNKE